MKKKFGFSLSEIMLGIVILGILLALLTPAIVKVSPSIDKTVVRRSFYTITTTVNDLLSNPLFYSHINEATGEIYEGFDDTSSITYRGTEYSGNSKFADLFIANLNYKGSIDTSATNCSGAFSGITIDTCKTVYIANGSKWTFATPSGTGNITSYILIDTNGDKLPNCRVDSTEDICKDPDVVYDQFRVIIYKNGKVIINSADGWAAQSIKSTGTIVD